MAEESPSAPQGPDGGTLLQLFARAARILFRGGHHPHAGHAQAHVLALLDERGGAMPQRELLDLLDVRSASLSEILGKLENAGLIVRRRDERDRRGFAVTMTETGRATAARALRRRENAEDVFSVLDSSEREELARLLDKLVASLAEFPREGRHCCGGRRGAGECRPGCGHGRGRHGGTLR